MLRGLWQFLTTRAPLGGDDPDMSGPRGDVMTPYGVHISGPGRRKCAPIDIFRVDVLCDLVSVVTFGGEFCEQTREDRQLTRDAVASYLERLDRLDPLRDRATLAEFIRRASHELGYLHGPDADDVAALVLQYGRNAVMGEDAAAARMYQHRSPAPGPCEPGECDLCDAFRPLNPQADDAEAAVKTPAGTNGKQAGSDGLADGFADAAGSNAVVSPECGAAEPVGARGLYVGLRRTGDGPTGEICRCAGCGLAHRVRADLKCPFCGGCALPGRKAPVVTTTAVVNGVPRTYQTAVREDYAGRTGSVAA